MARTSNSRTSTLKPRAVRAAGAKGKKVVHEAPDKPIMRGQSRGVSAGQKPAKKAAPRRPKVTPATAVDPVVPPIKLITPFGDLDNLDRKSIKRRVENILGQSCIWYGGVLHIASSREPLTDVPKRPKPGRRALGIQAAFTPRAVPPPSPSYGRYGQNDEYRTSRYGGFGYRG